LQEMLSNNRILRRLRNLHLLEKLFLQGLILSIILIIIQFEFDLQRNLFISYMPPLGYVFLLVAMYIVQPIIIGVLNIFFINFLYKTKGWQVGFWLNGIFLILIFSTINMILQTVLNLPFNYVALIDVIALSFPFGCIARFSNGGWKKPID